MPASGMLPPGNKQTPAETPIVGCGQYFTPQNNLLAIVSNAGILFTNNKADPKIEAMCKTKPQGVHFGILFLRRTSNALYHTGMYAPGILDQAKDCDAISNLKHPTFEAVKPSWLETKRVDGTHTHMKRDKDTLVIYLTRRRHN